MSCENYQNVSTVEIDIPVDGEFGRFKMFLEGCRTSQQPQGTFNVLLIEVFLFFRYVYAVITPLCGEWYRSYKFVTLSWKEKNSHSYQICHAA